MSGKHLSKLIQYLIALVIAGICCVVILTDQFTTVLRPISLQVYSGFVLFLPQTFIILTIIFSLPARFQPAVSFTATMVLFAFALSGLQASGNTTTLYIGGLLPWSDASNYYWDAQRLLNGWNFSGIASRRPLFTSLLALVLGIANGNLQLVQVILTLMTAVGCWLAVRVVIKRFGPAPAALFLTLLIFYYRRFAGSLMTENLGLLLGGIGFALFFEAAEQRSIKRALVGLAALALGLISRAGPFFILLAVGWWLSTTLQQAKSSMRHKLLLGLLSVGVILVCFGFNQLIFKHLSSPGSQTFSNFSYSFYGLTTGGMRWDKVFVDHPELRQLPTDQQANAIYRLALQNIVHYPLLLVQGIGRQYYYLISPTWYNSYSYVEGENRALSLAVQYVLMALAVWGGVRAWKQRKKPIHSLLLLAWAGILLSVPFVPPVDTNRMRSYAAVIPFLAALPALGLQDIFTRLKIRQIAESRETFPSFSNASLVAFIILYAGLLTAPNSFYLFGSSRQTSDTACPADLVKIEMQLPEGTYLTILPESTFLLDRSPNLHAGRFRRMLHNIPFGNAIAEFESLEPPVMITTGIDLQTGGGLWLSIDGEKFSPTQGEVSAFCGQWSETDGGKEYRFFQAEYQLN